MDIKPFIPTNIPVSYKDEQMSEMEKESLKSCWRDGSGISKNHAQADESYYS
jgi:hypothetical protein